MTREVCHRLRSSVSTFDRPRKVLLKLTTLLTSQLLTSSVSRALHCMNMPSIVITLLISQPLTSSVSNFKHCLNISVVEVALLVYQPLTSPIVVSKMQPLNMPLKLTTLSVFHRLRSRFSNFLQLRNILYIWVTLLVSHPLMSPTEVRLLQLLNKLYIDFTDEVSH